ncbi:hypothetical protein AAHB37_14840 [Glutamicibacter halophytocola]|uniref:hypothetical protein n=1 Tax=Glutamicibacter halophytocola TaxID=1933880 RepID=UPI003218EF0B
MKTTTPAWLIVALREVETKLRDKAFIISTIGTLLVIIGSIVVSSILGGRTAEFSVAATDESSYEVLDQVQKDKPGDMRLSIAKATEPEARQQLADGELDAMLSSSNGSQEYSLTGYDGVDEQLSQLVADGVDTVLTDRVLSSAGLDATSLPGCRCAGRLAASGRRGPEFNGQGHGLPLLLLVLHGCGRSLACRLPTRSSKRSRTAWWKFSPAPFDCANCSPARSLATSFSP